MERKRVSTINHYGNIIYFKMHSISTANKPGELVDLDLKYISRDLGINFNLCKSFYINKLNSNLSRGNHSNNNCQELLFCLNGSFNIRLFNGKDTYKFSIKQDEGVFIPKNIWIEFDNFDNCIILAFIDIEISDKDSCYNIEEFKKK